MHFHRVLRAMVLVAAYALLVAHPAVAFTPDETLCNAANRDPMSMFDACSRVIAAPDSAAALRLTAYQNRSQVFFMQGRLAEAEADISAAIELAPTDPAGYTLRCLYHLAMSKFEAAAADCSDGLKHGGEDAGLLAMRGHAYATMGQRDAAMVDLQRAIELAPDNPATYVLLAEIYRFRNQLDEALATVDKGLAIAPDDLNAGTLRGALLALLDREDEALAEFDRVLQKMPLYGPAYRERAALYVERKDIAKAQFDFEMALQTTTIAHDVAAILVDRSLMWMNEHDYAAARADAAKAQEIVPGFMAARMVEIYVLMREARYRDAIARLDDIIENEQPNFTIYLARASAFGYEREFEKAFADCRTAAATGAIEPVVHTACAHVHSQQLDYEKAIAEYNQALAIDARNADALTGRAFSLMNAGRFEESLDDYEAADEIDPEDMSVHNGWCYALAALGDVDEAAPHCDLAVELNRRFDGVALDARGYMQMRKGDFAAALGSFDEAIALGHPDRRWMSEFHYGRANVLRLMGRAAEAQAAFDEARRYDDRVDRYFENYPLDPAR